ncbi:universal stress protein [Mesorhizobium sp. SP-1A]|uniref:universal stress protein n=1 Tax=Mesorhizobium sp. SP-1A TaxID=3077840 RepID=UPI0028F71B48|nr:universal stress protein [Mesorhizobium sp. SP-1A]
MYKHILIATDGSDLAGRGVRHGIALAKALVSKVTVIMATDPMPLSGIALGAGWVPSTEELADYRAAQTRFADEILSRVKAEAAQEGVAVEPYHVADSRAADAILQTAAAKGCDLIVMASHGRRGVERVLLGSQTAEVVAHSGVPVLVVR